MKADEGTSIFRPILGILEGACVIDAIHDLEEMEGVVQPSVGELKLPQVSSLTAAEFSLTFRIDCTATAPRSSSLEHT